MQRARNERIGKGKRRNMEKMEQKSAGTRPACESCNIRKKERGEKEYKDLMNRLSRVEGQIRGIKKMLETDAYCIDILNQVSAAGAALDSFGRVLLERHIRTCVTEDILQGDKQGRVDELIKIIEKMTR